MASKQAGSTVGFNVKALHGSHWTAIALAAITGSIHIYLYFQQGWLMFLLAGLGFFGAIGLILVLPDYRKWLYAAGIPYTLAQIVGWYMVEQPGSFGDISDLALFDKLVQITLILLLTQLFRTAE
ncbi:DUF7475 family protein [Halorubrum sp. HHNYT27]|uniref:DUF7475 family protein n=1 Tax=Halorubrum sp. HHNYT27 TaxID=3402275 RepID=UPI003EBA85AC